MCNTVAPFSRATSPSLIVLLYLAYSKLLKLTAASNEMCMKNSRFSTNIWSITAERSRLMTDLGYRTWADDDVGAVNDVHSWMTRPRMSGQLYITQATEAMSKTNCPKTSPPCLETLKVRQFVPCLIAANSIPMSADPAIPQLFLALLLSLRSNITIKWTRICSAGWHPRQATKI